MSVETSASAQAKSLQSQAGYWIRSDLRVVRVSGDDRVSWLNGQVTNDVRSLEHGGSVRALAVHVRGKIMAELWIVAHGDELLVVVPASAEPTLLESFERYIIMEDVTLGSWPEARVLAVLGPAASELAAASTAGEAVSFAYDDLRLGGSAFIGTPDVLAPIAESLRTRGVVEIDERGYELARLRAGVPRFGVDFSERSYPQEAGLKQLVSFNKGCYLGQEVVCTLENRGKLTRQLALWRGVGAPEVVPSPGASLITGANDATGEVTSAVWDPDGSAVLALGYVKRAHAQPGVSLTAAGVQLTLERLIGV